MDWKDAESMAHEDLGDPAIAARPAGYPRAVHCISKAIRLLDLAADSFAFESTRTSQPETDRQRALRLVDTIRDLRSLEDATAHLIEP